MSAAIRGRNYPGSLLGVGGRPVYQVAHRGLSVALSQIGPADLDPDIPRVRAYERVVLSYHRRGAVVPMRYGCVVEQESQAIQLLEEHGPHYEALLQELDGCVEMGLRVLLPSGPWAAVIPGGPEGSREVAGPCPPDPAAAPDRLGLTYLTARKAHYATRTAGPRSIARPRSAAGSSSPDCLSNAPRKLLPPDCPCSPCISWCPARPWSLFAGLSGSSPRPSRPGCCSPVPGRLIILCTGGSQSHIIPPVGEEVSSHG